MGFIYETHLHTSPASACGVSSGSEHVRFYKSLGYQGIIITDHFFRGNTGVPRNLPWRERINMFCSGYEDALNEGEKLGLDVFFGWEEGFRGDEYLVYGLDKTFMLEHPEMEHWTRCEQHSIVRANGGCVIQAHPFRNRGYIPQILLGESYADGAEVANAGNEPFNDWYAYSYAQKRGLVMTAGSDNHEDAMWIKRGFMGVETDHRLKDIHDFVKVILNREPLKLHLPEGRLEANLSTAPCLESAWLDENEQPKPTGIDWLRE